MSENNSTRWSETLEGHVGAAEGDNEVERDEPPRRRAEHEVAETQDPAKVEVGRFVDAVQGVGQAAIHPQGGVAAEEAPGPEQSGSLSWFREMASRTSPEREEAALHDPIQEFLDQLGAGDPFRQVLRQEADVVQCGGQFGTQVVAQVPFGIRGYAVQDVGQLAPLPIGDPHPRKPPLRCGGAASGTSRWLGSSRRIGRRPSERTQCITLTVEIIRTWSTQTFCKS